MEDNYGRKIQCPSCNSYRIYEVRIGPYCYDKLCFCLKCNKQGYLEDFRAVPILGKGEESFNPSKRYQDYAFSDLREM